jgi:hypothetical protein
MKKLLFVLFVCVLSALTVLANSNELISPDSKEAVIGMEDSESFAEFNVQDANSSNSGVQNDLSEKTVSEFNDLINNDVDSGIAHVSSNDMLAQTENRIDEKSTAETFLSDSAAITSKTNNQIVFKEGKYYLNDNVITNKEIKNLLSNNPKSKAKYEEYKSFKSIGILLGTVILICGPVGGIALEAIIITVSGGIYWVVQLNKMKKDAIVLYNSSLN